MSELEGLGRLLRTRRKEIRLPAAELARRIGVSSTYVWLVEEARPRAGGKPSRPSEDVLERWLQALGVDPATRREARALAGYFEVLSAVEETSPEFPTLYATRLPPPTAAPAPCSARADEAPASHLPGQVESLLEAATAQGRRGEAAYLLESFLDWLRHHLEREP